MFSNNLILFYKADPTSILLLMSTLSQFHKTAGLKSNLHKSQMVLGGISPEQKSTCLQVSGLPKSTFPLRYLGVPILAGRLSKVDCNQLVEKIKAKVYFWGT